MSQMSVSAGKRGTQPGDEKAPQNSSRKLGSDTSVWDEYTHDHPLPPFELRDPVIAHLLTQWTTDTNKVLYLLSWVDCLRTSLPPGFPMTLQIVGLTADVRDGFLHQLIPIVKHLSNHALLVFSRCANDELAAGEVRTDENLWFDIRLKVVTSRGVNKKSSVAVSSTLSELLPDKIDSIKKAQASVPVSSLRQQSEEAAEKKSVEVSSVTEGDQPHECTAAASISSVVPLVGSSLPHPRDSRCDNRTSSDGGKGGPMTEPSTGELRKQFVNMVASKAVMGTAESKAGARGDGIYSQMGTPECMHASTPAINGNGNAMENAPGASTGETSPAGMVENGKKRASRISAKLAAIR